MRVALLKLSVNLTHFEASVATRAQSAACHILLQESNQKTAKGGEYTENG